jgi:N-acetylglucosaminyldiphosphoundecaprenol N-acetyl-beta-D-mannosaminyltransferase
MNDRAAPGVRVCNSTLFAGNVDDACARIVARVRERRGGYICFANAHVVVMSYHDPAFSEALEKAWMVCPDGAPVAWIARRFGASSSERIAGADLMARLFDVGQTDGLKHFLFGSTPDVLEHLEKGLRARHRSAEIVGCLSPGIISTAEQGPVETIERLYSANADVVWCGLGAPKQELWMYRNARSLAPAILIGVGAAFYFHAGTKKRAPLWMQRTGLEWTHRFASEPKRLGGRYVRTNSEFVVRAGLELIRKRRRTKAHSS